MQISFILQCFEHLFHKIYFKEKEKYTKGLCERFLREENVRQNGMESHKYSVSLLKSFRANFFCAVYFRQVYHPALHLTFHQSKKIIILNKHFHYLHIPYNPYNPAYIKALTYTNFVRGSFFLGGGGDTSKQQGRWGVVV